MKAVFSLIVLGLFIAFSIFLIVSGANAAHDSNSAIGALTAAVGFVTLMRLTQIIHDAFREATKKTV